MARLTFIEASTSGHTSFVIDEMLQFLKTEHPEITTRKVRAETAGIQDLSSSDALVFGSGTWNTGGTEGQLNPFMHELLFTTLQGIECKKPMAFISLGDDRYYFTTRCTEHFLRFQRQAGGTSLLMPLVIVNEPYDQTEKIRVWAKKLLEAVKKI